MQADRAREVLLDSGVAQHEADQIHKWVRKADLKAGQAEWNDCGSQLLEDAAVLVFLEKEITGFAQKHQEYPEDKFVQILVKYVTASSCFFCVFFPLWHAYSLDAIPLPFGWWWWGSTSSTAES